VRVGALARVGEQAGAAHGRDAHADPFTAPLF